MLIVSIYGKYFRPPSPTCGFSRITLVIIYLLITQITYCKSFKLYICQPIPFFEQNIRSLYRIILQSHLHIYVLFLFLIIVLFILYYVTDNYKLILMNLKSNTILQFYCIKITCTDYFNNMNIKKNYYCEQIKHIMPCTAMPTNVMHAVIFLYAYQIQINGGRQQV